jgi:hypothetical protein
MLLLLSSLTLMPHWKVQGTHCLQPGQGCHHRCCCCYIVIVIVVVRREQESSLLRQLGGGGGVARDHKFVVFGRGD